jgi:hypothetical protein
VVSEFVCYHNTAKPQTRNPTGKTGKGVSKVRRLRSRFCCSTSGAMAEIVFAGRGKLRKEGKGIRGTKNRQADQERRLL